MANFTGKKPKDTYQRLVQIESDETNRFKRFQDGLGNPIATASFDTLEVLHDLHVRSGSVFAQSFVTTYVTSSTLFQSGSTQFGDDLTDNHAFTGSVEITGSLKLAGTDLNLTGSFNHLGQYNHEGNLIQNGTVTLNGASEQIGNSIITGLITLNGSAIIGGNITQVGNHFLTGSVKADGNISAEPGVFMNPKTFRSEQVVVVPANHNAVMFGPISNATTIRINKNSKLRILR
jgi:hypothetical protein|tara:strand:+ start:975 stop:1673 length:699 start_codon:yes stop_codon:yes gene_type:complete